jgi:hypothetical protein
LKKRSKKLFLLGVPLVAASAFAQEPRHCLPIQFARGAYSSIVRGSAGSDEPFPCYTLATGKGQTATLRFVGTNGNMAFSIDGVVDDRDAFSFSTEVKTYKFEVFQTLRSPPAPFALDVTVK